MDIPIRHTNPPPGLHIVIGEGGDLIDKMEDLSYDFAQDFLEEVHVVKSPMCGGEGFRGNDARKLFRCGGGLRILRRMADNSKLVGPRGDEPVSKLVARTKAFRRETMHLLIDTAEAFDVVIEEIFGPILGDQWLLALDAWEHSWQAFEKAYERLFKRRGRSLQTPKKYCICEIVRQFVGERNLSLGLFSEQAFETAHSVLAAHEKLYSIPRCGEARRQSKRKAKRRKRRKAPVPSGKIIGNVKEAALRRRRAIISFDVSNLPDDQASIERQEMAVAIYEGKGEEMGYLIDGKAPWNRML